MKEGYCQAGEGGGGSYKLIPCPISGPSLAEPLPNPPLHIKGPRHLIVASSCVIETGHFD